MSLTAKSVPGDWFARITKFVGNSLNSINVWGGPVNEEKSLAFRAHAWFPKIEEVPHRLSGLYWQGAYTSTPSRPTKFVGFSGPTSGHWHEPFTDNEHANGIMYKGVFYSPTIIVAGVCIVTTIDAFLNETDWFVFAKHDTTHIRFYKQTVESFVAGPVSLTEFGSYAYVRNVSANNAETVWFSGDGLNAVWLDQSEMNSVDDLQVPEGYTRFWGYLNDKTNRTREYQFEFDADLSGVVAVVVDGDQPTITSVDTLVGDVTHNVVVIPKPAEDDEEDTVERHDETTRTCNFDHTFDLCSVYINDTIVRASHRTKFTFTYEKTDDYSSVFIRTLFVPTPSAWVQSAYGDSTVDQTCSGTLLYELTTPNKTYQKTGSFSSSASGSRDGYLVADPPTVIEVTNTGSGEGYNIFNSGLLTAFGEPEQAYLPEIYTGARMVFNYVDLYNDLYSILYYRVRQDQDGYAAGGGAIGTEYSFDFKQARNLYDPAANTPDTAPEQGGVTEVETILDAYPTFRDDGTGVPPARIVEYARLINRLTQYPLLPWDTTKSFTNQNPTNTSHTKDFSGDMVWYETFLFPYSFRSTTFTDNFCTTAPVTFGTLYRSSNDIPRNGSAAKEEMNTFVNWANAIENLDFVEEVGPHTYATDDVYSNLVNISTEFHFVSPP